MPSEKYEFLGHTGQTLAGLLELPEDDIRGYALFAHCFTCSKDFVASRNITQALAKQGIATLRFDFTGLGNSAGDFANTDFSANVEDLIHAANALTKSHQAPKLLVGHSLGGAAILAAAPFIHSATSVATIAAPFDPAHVLHLFKDNLVEINSDGQAEVDLFGRTFTITKKFINDINQINQRSRIATMRKSLLVMHSPVDELVRIENAKMIYDAAMHPKSFVSLDDMDHLLMNPEDVAYVADILASWATRYMTKEAKPPIKLVQPKDDVVTITTTGHGPFSLSMQAGPHTVLADEPLSVGGKDTGATPYDFLMMAIGSCTAMTLRMYANHKNLSLDDLIIRLRHRRKHAKDGTDCDTDGGFIHEVEREIEFVGALSDAEQQRLLEIADRCPVHKTLVGQININTLLVLSDPKF